MTLSLISAPAMEPLSLSEVKSWIKVDNNDEDSVIQTLITGARLAVEASISRLLITQQWRLTLDILPDPRFLRLPLTPVQSVQRILVFDPLGADSVLATDSFSLEAHLDSARLVWSQAPPLPDAATGGIQIDLTVGYGDASAVPEPLRIAMLGLIAQWYANRGDGDYSSTRMPVGVATLLAPYRIRRLA